MQLPAILEGQSLTRLLQGAFAGVVATLIIGFNWGGWVTGGTAKEMTQKSASTALVTRSRSDLRRQVSTQPRSRRPT